MSLPDPDRGLRRSIARLASLDETTTRAIVAALDTGEQTRVLALLDAYAVPDAHLPLSAAGPVEVEYLQLSPWLQKRLVPSSEGANDKVTAMTREALRLAAAPYARVAAQRVARPGVSWRSRMPDLR